MQEVKRKGRKQKETTRKKISLSLKKYFSNPKAKKKASRAWKKYYQKHPEYSAKIDRAMTQWWREHPHVKKERSILLKNMFIKNPKKFKKFLKYGNNPSALSFKTKNGDLVRSRGEQKIADFLFDNKIKFSYEGKTLIFKKEGQICVPDFYLQQYKVYIEFYGGHPKSRKKKIMKNKLYKKYKIPCIFITPAELRNLNYYLIEEMKRQE